MFEYLRNLKSLVEFKDEQEKVVADPERYNHHKLFFDYESEKVLLAEWEITPTSLGQKFVDRIAFHTFDHVIIKIKSGDYVGYVAFSKDKLITVNPNNKSKILDFIAKITAKMVGKTVIEADTFDVEAYLVENIFHKRYAEIIKTHIMRLYRSYKKETGAPDFDSLFKSLSFEENLSLDDFQAKLIETKAINIITTLMSKKALDKLARNNSPVQSSRDSISEIVEKVDLSFLDHEHTDLLKKYLVLKFPDDQYAINKIIEGTDDILHEPLKRNIQSLQVQVESLIRFADFFEKELSNKDFNYLISASAINRTKFIKFLEYKKIITNPETTKELLAINHESFVGEDANNLKILKFFEMFSKIDEFIEKYNLHKGKLEEFRENISKKARGYRDHNDLVSAKILEKKAEEYDIRLFKIFCSAKKVDSSYIDLLKNIYIQVVITEEEIEVVLCKYLSESDKYNIEKLVELNKDFESFKAAAQEAQINFKNCLEENKSFLTLDDKLQKSFLNVWLKNKNKDNLYNKYVSYFISPSIGIILLDKVQQSDYVTFIKSEHIIFSVFIKAYDIDFKEFRNKIYELEKVIKDEQNAYFNGEAPDLLAKWQRDKYEDYSKDFKLAVRIRCLFDMQEKEPTFEQSYLAAYYINLAEKKAGSDPKDLIEADIKNFKKISAEFKIYKQQADSEDFLENAKPKLKTAAIVGGAASFVIGIGLLIIFSNPLVALVITCFIAATLLLPIAAFAGAGDLTYKFEHRENSEERKKVHVVQDKLEKQRPTSSIKPDAFVQFMVNKAATVSA